MKLLTKIANLAGFVLGNQLFIQDADKHIAEELINILSNYYGDKIIDLVTDVVKHRLNEKEEALKLSKLVVYDNICNLESLHKTIESNKKDKIKSVNETVLSSDRILFFLRLLAVNYPNGITSHSKSEIDYFNRIIAIIKKADVDLKWVEQHELIKEYNFIMSYENNK